MTTRTTFGIGTFEDGGHLVAGIVLGDTVIRLDRVSGALAGQSMEDLLAAWDASWPALEALATDPPADASVALDSLHAVAPIRPRVLLQSGANYRKHVVDLVVAGRRREDPDADLEAVREQAAAQMDARSAHGIPFVFIGLPSSMCGPYDDVILPRTGEEHDWELELGVVIGRTAHYVDETDAMNHVAGYVICNDITSRDLVFRKEPGALGADWFRAKNAPTFFPTGPWFVPAAFVPDPSALRITLRHNGDVMQDEAASDMIFGVAKVVSFASHTVQLEPGDLLLTGSPAGNGVHWGRQLQPGDVIEGQITGPGLEDPAHGFGVQRNRCVAEPA